MSRWGVVAGENEDQHVVPIDADETPLLHCAATWCWCRPWRDPKDQRIVVHEDEDSGACDAHAVTPALPVFLN